MKLGLLAESWMSLAIAILFGVLGTISLKFVQCSRTVKPWFFVSIFYTISFIALTFAMKQIELSIVYAVWSGVGTILVAIVGIFYFNESVSMRKALFLMLIVIGVIGIHLSDSIIS